MINTYTLTVSGQSQAIEGKQFIIENVGPSEVAVTFSSSNTTYELESKEQLDLGPFEANLSDTITVDFLNSSGVFNEVQILQLQ
jgi:hypothetical protein